MKKHTPISGTPGRISIFLSLSENGGKGVGVNGSQLVTIQHLLRLMRPRESQRAKERMGCQCKEANIYKKHYLNHTKRGHNGY